MNFITELLETFYSDYHVDIVSQYLCYKGNTLPVYGK